MASNIIGEQAVVIGGGMGGLAAAGALANHFEKVVVLERGLSSAERQRAAWNATMQAHSRAAGWRPARPLRTISRV